MQTKAKERMWLNKKRDELVVDNHKDASTLYAAKGDVVPETAMEKFGVGEDGLIKGAVAQKQRDKNEDKSRDNGEDKSRDDGEDKSRKGGGRKGSQSQVAGDPVHPLSSIKGIGKKTIASLAKVSIETLEDLADVKLDALPEAEGIPASADWKSWVDQATEQVLAA